MNSKRNQKYSISSRIIPAMLACSLAVSNMPLAFAAPGDINSTNTGSNPNAGTYYNTQGNQTSFIHNEGLTFTGTYNFLESNQAGATTGNGGNAFIQAPYVGMTRATLNASALKDGNGNYTGNGGNIRINARLLYATDSDILVAGKSGGSVTMSVGSLFSRNTKIDATGSEGVGGRIRVDASNIVDLDKNTLFNASGKVVGTFDNSLIDIKGAVVNMDGILKANGMGSQGGHINLTSAGNPDECLDCDVQNAQRFGVLDNAGAQDIRVTFNKLKNDYGSTIIGSTGQIHANGADGAIVTVDTGRDYNYARAGGGGTITINAQKNIKNSGTLSAKGGEGQRNDVTLNPGDKIEDIILNGGHGGTISMLAGPDGTVTNSGTANVNGGNGVNFRATLNDGAGHTFSYDAGGYGGDGGVIAISGKQTINSGSLLAKGGNAGDGASAYAEVNDYQINLDGKADTYAYGARGSNGGNGGLIVLNNTVNPTNTGTMDVRGGNGGAGGDATAKSFAQSAEANATANAIAIAGDAGEGGLGGTIVMKSPGSFTNGGSVLLGGGNSGVAGKAVAKADSYGIYHSRSNAFARGNAQSTSTGNSYSLDKLVNATSEVYATKAPGAIGRLDTLRPTEAIVHNGSTIILNNTAAGPMTLSGLVSGANVRTTGQQAGGASIPVLSEDLGKNLVVGSISGQDLTINNGGISSRFAGINNVNINTGASLVNADNFVTRNVSAIAKNDITNVGNIATGESLFLGAGRDVINNGNLTSSSEFQGGSIVINAGGKLTNVGQISAGSLNYGGAVQIRAAEIVNEASGRIAANSWSQYGNGTNNLAFNPSGGMVNLTGRRISNRGTVSADQVDGRGNGGQIWMLAKEGINNEANGKITADALTGGNIVVGVKDGKLVNDGLIQANTGGKIILADMNSTGEARKIICLPPVSPPPPPPPPVSPPPVDTGLLIPSTGPVDTAAILGVPPTVEVADANLFLARGFEGMTKGILDQAYVTYQSALERGNDVTNANQKAIEYLMQAGMTCCVAKELATRIETGKMSLNTGAENQKLDDLLNVIAGTCLPEDGGETLIQ